MRIECECKQRNILLDFDNNLSTRGLDLMCKFNYYKLCGLTWLQFEYEEGIYYTLLTSFNLFRQLKWPKCEIEWFPSSPEFYRLLCLFLDLLPQFAHFCIPLKQFWFFLFESKFQIKLNGDYRNKHLQNRTPRLLLFFHKILHRILWHMLKCVMWVKCFMIDPMLLTHNDFIDQLL